MILKGLPNYEVFFDQGEIRVWSLVSKVWKKKQEGSAPRFHLRTEGRTRDFSPGFLRFLMLHPDIDANEVSPAESRIRFADDGSVMGLHEGNRGDKYSLFRDVDDALATVLAMKAAESGDIAFIHEFIARSRENAVWTVTKLLKTTAAKVRECLEDGENLFVEQVSTARCERIIPLYAWLCRCIKSAMLRRRKLVSIEGKGLASSKILSAPFE